MKKILVLGATGMLGNVVFRVLSSVDGLETWGTIRSTQGLKFFEASKRAQLFSDVDVLNNDLLVKLLTKLKPDVVINCVGLVKQQACIDDPLVTLPVNSILPHRLAGLCDLTCARLIHISTDCVFSGRKGMYSENDLSDAQDLYGKSKYIGEIHGAKNSITLRTSIIGHELGTKHALVDWFLSEKDSVKGFTKAIFSGVPTIELARVIKDYVLPDSKLSGLYHVAAKPIDKFSLLGLVAAQYGSKTKIVPCNKLVIDRSLDGSRFQEATGYIAPSWPDLIASMSNDYKLSLT